ncbi:DUF899 domain-containing protein [Mesorhizobium sp. M7A.F.Ca.CA.001.09.2.1]|nr:DUF899 domain-containing protein [Mesorhizobium sp. M7A.F.Ca.CA.001.13.2.1]RUY63200.1 DUF899 domain-containing protein [Mesorhizobium sp. M7A.F.Ca.CA.001.05.1.1]RUY71600.1 DUF899 domain-containing protein [Mesorhizobium sp. M7A.F.Ca.CA.001.13.1.1]RUY81040.1 DUF899 domain-containing protein [Mesorhizobium sp. M7A.F.Ca.CA.001.09.2.1]RUZ07162.1 DUF899 domain-containing protein [Mesorhizobium sp. M7A.F.Ca.CA.001.04.2.1]RUZ22328.1 DUF899 domain-containing protein [Mesorhizobium sp. M7A.F.Ca.CA.0
MAHSRARDTLAAERWRLPWLAVEKNYAFEGLKGRVSLLDRKAAYDKRSAPKRSRNHWRTRQDSNL